MQTADVEGMAMAEPLYRQIAAELRAKIESGELAPGDPLPAEKDLREQYEAARNTIRDAIKSLTVAGLLVARPGQGTFVAERPVPFLVTMSSDPRTGLGGGEGDVYRQEATERGWRPTLSAPQVAVQPAAADVARELQLSAEDNVIIRHQQLQVDDRPWCLQTSFYPMWLLDLGASRLQEAPDIVEGTVTYLANSVRVQQVGYWDTLIARPPNSGELGYFDLEADSGVAMIVQTRTAFDARGRPFRCTVTVWRGDRNQLVYKIGQTPEQAAGLPQAGEVSS